MSFFSELRRRNVFRVAASYVVVGWLIIQVASALSAPLNLPSWFETVVIVLLAIGFPVSLLFAWAFELTPDGVKVSQNGAADPAAGSNKLDYVLIGSVALVIAVTIWGRLGSSSFDSVSRLPINTQDPSVAVLPFADMSPNGDQEYFGDGIAEELLNELTRLDGLRVAGRTSSFSFKRSSEDLRTIGKALGVSSILEGSVRKDRDRIRVTAQLINAADGYHLWSETFDRELTDIFAVQEEIATAVAGVLGVTLGVGGVNEYRGAGTRDVEAYEAYMKGLSLALSQEPSIPLFERAVELDPNYAAAWAQLGLRTAGAQWESSPQDAAEIRERAYGFVLKAVELDPDSAQAISLLGTMLASRHDWVGSERAHAKALSLLADRPNLTQYGNMLMRAGRIAEAAKQLDAAQAVEPMGGQPTFRRLNVSLAQGRYAEAREMAEWFSGPQNLSARIDIALNARDAERIMAVMAAMPSMGISTTALYSPVSRVFDSPENVISLLQALYADDTTQWPSKLHDIAMLAAYFGYPELALQMMGEEVRNTIVRLQAVWYPVMSEVRLLPGFKELVDELNLDTYWRTYGWADACRPLGNDDFMCN